MFESFRVGSMAVVLITGANRGIGLALVKKFAQTGATVIATVRRPDAAGDLSRVAEDYRPAVEIHQLDATDSDSVLALARVLEGRDIDVLINNAGVLNSYGDISDPAHDWAAWQEVLMTNTAAPYIVTRALLAHVRRSGAGKIAFISSSMASSARAPGGAYPYRASKAGVTNLARNLATDLKKFGIAVGAYHPGWVRTAMGGEGAAISVDESAEGLFERINHLSLETTGVFEDYQGNAVQF